MVRFGLDLSVKGASRFDTAFRQLVGTGLQSDPNAETRLHSFCIHSTLQRRVVEMSDHRKLMAFATYWRSVGAETELAPLPVG